jgi:hypothetical protein
MAIEFVALVSGYNKQMNPTKRQVVVKQKPISSIEASRNFAKKNPSSL